jgi:signal peptidase I
MGVLIPGDGGLRSPVPAFIFVPSRPSRAVADRTATVSNVATSRTERPARTPTAPPKGAGGETWEWVKSLGVALLLFVVIRTFLLQAFSIPSGSMENTLLVGDYLMANNTVFGPRIPFTEIRLPGIRDPRRGEVVVFRPTYNRPVIDVVKRVIGVPGDTLQMRDGVVYRNGKRLEEPYATPAQGPDEPIPFVGSTGVFLSEGVDPARYGYHNHLPALLPSVERESYRPTRDHWGPLVVPAGSYFLMGDNRGASLDSRYMGFIPREVVTGKPMFIYFSYDPTLERPFSFVTAARWGRIGTGIR